MFSSAYTAHACQPILRLRHCRPVPTPGRSHVAEVDLVSRTQAPQQQYSLQITVLLDPPPRPPRAATRCWPRWPPAVHPGGRPPPPPLPPLPPAVPLWWWPTTPSYHPPQPPYTLSPGPTCAARAPTSSRWDFGVARAWRAQRHHPPGVCCHSSAKTGSARCWAALSNARREHHGSNHKGHPALCCPCCTALRYAPPCCRLACWW